MHNKLTPLEATEIGARIRAARLRANKSLIEIGIEAGVHHSQVSRCERGLFKTAGRNLQKICINLQITHPKLVVSNSPNNELRERFDALLETFPDSATAFSNLFDILESVVKKATPRQPEN